MEWEQPDGTRRAACAQNSSRRSPARRHHSGADDGAWLPSRSASRFDARRARHEVTRVPQRRQPDDRGYHTQHHGRGTGGTKDVAPRACGGADKEMPTAHRTLSIAETQPRILTKSDLKP